MTIAKEVHVAQIQAEVADADREQRRRLDALLQALNTLANRHEELHTNKVLALAEHYDQYLSFGVPQYLNELENERLERAERLISGWLAYIRSGVSDASIFDLVGDSAIWLEEVGG